MSSNDIAIHAEGISKLYHLGAASKKAQYSTLRDTVTSMGMAPIRRVQSMRHRGSHAHGKSGRSEMWALKDISFEVKRGEVVGIIGRNGAGKSTLLKVLSRITEPTSGRAEIRGRVGSLLEVGTGFHPELTGRENIFLNGAILGMHRSEIERKFDEIVAFAEVERFIDTAVKHYSSGMYLRLAFAVAANMETEILLVDEVLAVGDMAFQAKCLGKMGEVSKAGRTVLFVSHNMTAISNLTNRCIALSDGKVANDGNTSLVIRDYLSDSTASGGKVQWDHPRPGDEHTFEFISCQIGPDGSDTEFSSDTPLDITMRFQVKKPTQGLRAGFDLISHEGVLVFRAYHDDQVQHPGVVEPGLYEVVGSIPPHLLNQGQYSITLRAGIQAVRKICLLDQVITFTIVNLSGSNSQYGNSRPGVINPAINWSATRLGDVQR